jgi:uncharacterized protein YkwD
LNLRIAVPAILIGVAATASPAAAAEPTCGGADRLPADVSAAAVRTATLCLLNAERGAASVRPLHHGSKLAEAARGHSRAMVEHRFFGHDSRSGATFSSRIARTGWMRGRRSWSVGENLAWGTRARAAPRAIVDAWMTSPAHRRTILHERFHAVGIGVAHGVPTRTDAAGATYTTDFGS